MQPGAQMCCKLKYMPHKHPFGVKVFPVNQMPEGAAFGPQAEGMVLAVVTWFTRFGHIQTTEFIEPTILKLSQPFQISPADTLPQESREISTTLLSQKGLPANIPLSTHIPRPPFSSCKHTRLPDITLAEEKV